MRLGGPWEGGGGAASPLPGARSYPAKMRGSRGCAEGVAISAEMGGAATTEWPAKAQGASGRVLWPGGLGLPSSARTIGPWPVQITSGIAAVLAPSAGPTIIPGGTITFSTKDRKASATNARRQSDRNVAPARIMLPRSYRTIRRLSRAIYSCGRRRGRWRCREMSALGRGCVKTRTADFSAQ
jgi:hypothetical protein